jgi:hypothetical protein
MELLQKNHPCGKLKPGGCNGLLNLWSEAIVCPAQGRLHVPVGVHNPETKAGI